MIEAAIKKILDLAPVRQRIYTTLDEDGVDKEYSDVELYPVRPHKLPTQKHINVTTLTGVTNWLLSDDGDEARDKCIVHVHDHKRVSVYSYPDDYYRERHHFIEATSLNDEFEFGRFMSVEDFVINASCKFVMDDALRNVIKVVSSLRATDVIHVEDDGLSQKLTATRELNRIGEVKLEPFQILRPFRTFREIEQPESRFLLRIKRNGDELPRVALFNADNSEWKLVAMRSIVEFINEKLGLMGGNAPNGINVIM